VPWLYEPGGRARRHARASQSPRRDDDLLLARADFPFDFGLALTPEQAQQIPQIQEMVDSPPEWLADWGRQVGAKLEDGLREAPSYIAFARENGDVYHTYTVSAPDPFVAPYHSFLLDRTPKPEGDEPRAWRKDEYPD
jgi:predicted dithiol-disulfide oxidoreductase (DUF899 family)